ncbi:hypothetical protein M3G03_11030 [Aestuariimicrobium sp. p3-SID1156]|uniref:arsenate-mycothiol transferase ArsC n=1 Tax=Aestuariimicrobium sp. p3-SID1156 TaxID=2916038 RepID=UPI00223B307F|nr:hypothetical protein [Aestuariimicrobium sp. p3-SID1156]MCT1460061.1 hypothetical protein [Aestuariimicrobium sp. p3-SID1156]
MNTQSPTVLFVCVKNGGKSQMAAALMRQLVGDRVTVESAGIQPGSTINQQSAEAIAEIGGSMTEFAPQQLTDEMLRKADRVVVIGSEAEVTPVDGMTAPIEVWETDEPSLRGIEGMERMRLVRDDINRRVLELAMEFTGQPTDNSERYLRIVEDLGRQFDGTFTNDEVRQTVRDAHAKLLTNRTITLHLPVLVERFAREQLLARARNEGKEHYRKPELVFVCVQNAGRSQMAAAFAERFSEGRVRVHSAGSQPVDELNPAVVSVLAERGIELTEAYPKPLTESVLQAADVVVTMGCGDSCPVIPGRRQEDWKVADPHGASLDEVRTIADDIEGRVRGLLGELLD